MSNHRRKRRNFAKPLESLLNTQMMSKRSEADKRPENCWSPHVEFGAKEGAKGKCGAYQLERLDCVAALVNEGSE